MTITTGRKVRADAKLEQLNEAQRERLHFWFEENCTYCEVVKLVREEFGLSVGKSAVGVYYRRHVLSVQQQDDTEIVAELAALPVADFDQATLQRAKALLWSALARPQPEVDLAAKLSGIISKAERQALAVRKLELEERKVALREKLAGLRTTKHPKGYEKGGESAGVVGRNEDAEIAAKAQSGEGRSKGPEETAHCATDTAAACDSSTAAEMYPPSTRSHSSLQNGSELAEEKNAGDAQNSPRFPGYSEVVWPQAEAEVARESRESTRSPRQEEEPRNTRKDTKGAEGSEESAEVVGRNEGAEVAAKARSGEGRSEGAEAAELADVLLYSPLASFTQAHGVRDRAA